MTVNPYQSPTPGASATQVASLPVRATGVLTADDAHRALTAATNRHRFAAKAVLAIILLALFAGMALIAYRRPELRWATVLQAAMLLMIGLPLFFLAKRQFTAAWNSRPENRQPVSWTFSNDGLLVETSAGKQLHYWNNFIYALIPADKVILAQHGGTMFHFVPRRFFETDEDWNAVCQLLALKLPVRGTAIR